MSETNVSHVTFSALTEQRTTVPIKQLTTFLEEVLSFTWVLTCARQHAYGWGRTVRTWTHWPAPCTTPHKARRDGWHQQAVLWTSLEFSPIGVFYSRKSREVKLHSSLLGPHLKIFHWKSWKTRNWLGSKHICCALESTTHWAPQWGKATSSNTSASRGINISPLFLPPVHSQGKSLVLRHIFTQMTGRLEACRQLERALSDPVPEPKANNHT